MLNGITNIDSQVVAFSAASRTNVKLDVPQASDVSVLDSKPPFISPAVRLDPVAKQVVLEFRDLESGEVVKQIPSERQILAYSSSVETAPVVEGSINTENLTIDSNTPSQSSTTNNVQSPQSLGPSGTLGDGDTSSFTV